MYVWFICLLFYVLFNSGISCDMCLKYQKKIQDIQTWWDHQGLFWLWAQPMRNDVTMKCHFPLAEPIARMIPASWWPHDAHVMKLMFGSYFRILILACAVDPYFGMLCKSLSIRIWYLEILRNNELYNVAIWYSYFLLKMNLSFFQSFDHGWGLGFYFLGGGHLQPYGWVL